MANYVENIKVGSGETWPVRDKEAHERITDLWSTIYPVGSIYMSVNDTSPELLFGGEWEQIQDTFLLAAGSTYSAGTTGGEAEHRLTLEEMPRHTHEVLITNGAHPTGNSALLNNAETVMQYTNNITATAATGHVGNNLPHNNMPPYLAVYMWQRTA